MVGNDSQNGASAAAAAEAAEAYVEKERIDAITLENGIILKLKLVPPLLISDAARRVPRPEIPTVWSESKDRNEENPADPDYLQSLIEWRGQSDEAGLNVAMIMGTEPSHVPEGMHMPESDAWLTEIEATYAAIDMEPPGFDRDSPSGRYLAWLRYYAIPSEDDLVRVSTILTSGVAVSQEDVRAAVDAFWDRRRKSTDIQEAIYEIAANRNRDRAEVTGDSQ